LTGAGCVHTLVDAELSSFVNKTICVDVAKRQTAKVVEILLFWHGARGTQRLHQFSLNHFTLSALDDRTTGITESRET
jgi:hypothetical protein